MNNTKDNSVFRAKLKKAREEKKMTQVQVAAFLGIKTRAYQNIEYGKTLGSINHWDKLEDLFNIHQRVLRELSTHEIVE